MTEARERELLRFVCGIVAGDAPAITPETPLFAERLLTSMNILDLIGYVEAALGRRLEDDEIVMSNFTSVRTIARTFLADGR